MSRNQAEIRRLSLSKTTEERLEAVHQLKSNFEYLSDKSAAFVDLHRLTCDEDTDVRMAASEALVSMFSVIPYTYQSQVGADIVRLTSDEDSDVRAKAATYLVSIVSSVSDDYKSRIWPDLHNLTCDENSYLRTKAAESLTFVLPAVPNQYKSQAWDDLHRLTCDEDSSVRMEALATLRNLFPSIPDEYKSVALDDLERLAYEDKSNPLDNPDADDLFIISQEQNREFYEDALSTYKSQPLHDIDGLSYDHFYEKHNPEGSYLMQEEKDKVGPEKIKVSTASQKLKNTTQRNKKTVHLDVLEELKRITANSSYNSCESPVLLNDENIINLIIQFQNAITQEIKEKNKGNKNSIFKLQMGKCVSSASTYYVYRFLITPDISFSDDTPLEILIDNTKYDANIVSVDTEGINIGVGVNLGNTIQSATIFVDNSKSLEILHSLYEKVKSWKINLNLMGSMKLFGFQDTKVLSEPIQKYVDLSKYENLPNKEQKEAIVKSLAQEVTFIWGPPGTGKTRVLSIILEQCIRANKKVLLVSHTNLAVDEILIKYLDYEESKKYVSSKKIIRHGVPAKRNEKLDDLMIDKIAVSKEKQEELKALKKVLTSSRSCLNAYKDQNLLQLTESADQLAKINLTHTEEHSQTQNLILKSEEYIREVNTKLDEENLIFKHLENQDNIKKLLVNNPMSSIIKRIEIEAREKLNELKSLQNISQNSESNLDTYSNQNLLRFTELSDQSARIELNYKEKCSQIQNLILKSEEYIRGVNTKLDEEKLIFKHLENQDNIKKLLVNNPISSIIKRIEIEAREKLNELKSLQNISQNSESNLDTYSNQNLLRLTELSDQSARIELNYKEKCSQTQNLIAISEYYIEDLSSKLDRNKLYLKNLEKSGFIKKLLSNNSKKKTIDNICLIEEEINSESHNLNQLKIILIEEEAQIGKKLALIKKEVQSEEKRLSQLMISSIEKELEIENLKLNQLKIALVEAEAEYEQTLVSIVKEVQSEEKKLSKFKMTLIKKELEITNQKINQLKTSLVETEAEYEQTSLSMMKEIQSEEKKLSKFRMTLIEKELEITNQKINQLLSDLNEIQLKNKEIVSNYKQTISQIKVTYAELNISSEKIFSLEDLINLQNTLMEKIKDIDVKIKDIEQEIQSSKDSIFSNALVIACTITKAYIDQKLLNTEFDVMIVDEASMAQLPALFIIAGMISKNHYIISGDFRQLSPIASSETSEVKTWLKTDIFAQAGIENNINNDIADRRLAMLRQQYRMHESIANLINDKMYDGKLITSDEKIIEETNKIAARPPCKGHALCLIDTSSINPWCKITHFGSRINIYSAVLSVSLAKKAIEGGIDNVGIVVPYKLQAQLINNILEEEKMHEKGITAATVHKFQGNEKKCIIFDSVNSAPFGKGKILSGPFVNSEAGKLINVAISRTKGKFILIANRDYVHKHFETDDALFCLLNDIEMSGVTIYSKDILPSYFDKNIEKQLFPHNGLNLGNAEEMTSWNENNFYSIFKHELLSAKKRVVIFSPFITRRRISDVDDIFQVLIERGIKIYVITRSPEYQGSLSFVDTELTINDLKKQGVTVIIASAKVNLNEEIHEKYALIDENVFFCGSLNILSHSKSSEHMLAFRSKKIIDNFIKQFQIDEIIKNHESTLMDKKRHKRQNETDKSFEITDQLKKTLISQTNAGNCPNCQSPFVLMSDKENVYWCCPKDLEKGFEIKKNVPKLLIETIVNNLKIPCTKCNNGYLQYKVGQHGPFLSCNQYPTCKNSLTLNFK